MGQVLILRNIVVKLAESLSVLIGVWLVKDWNFDLVIVHQYFLKSRSGKPPGNTEASSGKAAHGSQHGCGCRVEFQGISNNVPCGASQLMIFLAYVLPTIIKPTTQ